MSCPRKEDVIEDESRCDGSQTRDTTKCLSTKADNVPQPCPSGFTRDGGCPKISTDDVCPDCPKTPQTEVSVITAAGRNKPAKDHESGLTKDLEMMGLGAQLAANSR